MKSRAGSQDETRGPGPSMWERADTQLLMHQMPSKHFWKVRVAITAPPGWSRPLSSLLLGSRGLGALKERQTNGFNVYHPEVPCHGNPGTPDSPSASGWVSRAG